MTRIMIVLAFAFALTACESLQQQPDATQASVGADRIVVDQNGDEIAIPEFLPQAAYANEDVGEGLVITTLKTAPWLRQTPVGHPSADVIFTPAALDTFRQGNALFVYVGDTNDEGGRAAIVPGSVWWPSAGVIDTAEIGSPQPLSSDDLQARLISELDLATGGDPLTQVVFYCDRPDCWLPYNAALRLAETEYQNVAWYRGGVEAWYTAGLPLEIAAAPNWF